MVVLGFEEAVPQTDVHQCITWPCWVPTLQFLTMWSLMCGFKSHEVGDAVAAELQLTC